MIEMLRALIGSPPAGFEWVEYVIVSVVLILIIKITIDVFFGIFRKVMKW